MAFHSAGLSAGLCPVEMAYAMPMYWSPSPTRIIGDWEIRKQTIPARTARATQRERRLLAGLQRLATAVSSASWVAVSEGPAVSSAVGTSRMPAAPVTMALVWQPHERCACQALFELRVRGTDWAGLNRRGCPTHQERGGYRPWLNERLGAPGPTPGGCGISRLTSSTVQLIVVLIRGLDEEEICE